MLPARSLTGAQVAVWTGCSVCDAGKRDRSRSKTPIRRTSPAKAARAGYRDERDRGPARGARSPQDAARLDRHASPPDRANGHDAAGG